MAPSLITLGTAALALAGEAAAKQFVLADTYDSTNFVDKFDFFESRYGTGNYNDVDPTSGYINYRNRVEATQNGLFSTDNGEVYLGVDSKNKTSFPGVGRSSVRLESKATYNKHLMVARFTHLPKPVCGSWPAFWSYGSPWPTKGELDWFEGWNNMAVNKPAAHTYHSSLQGECTISSTGQTGQVETPNCDNAAPGQYSNQGCTTSATSADPWGSSEGGVYAVEWTDDYIKFFAWRHAAAPKNIDSDAPDTASWGTPTMLLANSKCNIANHFKDQRLVINVGLCGVLAGDSGVWNGMCAASTGHQQCSTYVAENPSAFSDVYFKVKDIRIFKEGTKPVTSTTSSTTSSSKTSTTSSSTTSTTSSATSTTSSKTSTTLSTTSSTTSTASSTTSSAVTSTATSTEAASSTASATSTKSASASDSASLTTTASGSVTAAASSSTSTTATADVSSTAKADVSSTVTADVSSSKSTTTKDDVSSTAIADVSSTATADISSSKSTTTKADVSSTATADVSSTATADVSSTATADVSGSATADVSSTASATASASASASSSTSGSGGSSSAFVTFTASANGTFSATITASRTTSASGSVTDADVSKTTTDKQAEVTSSGSVTDADVSKTTTDKQAQVTSSASLSSSSIPTSVDLVTSTVYTTRVETVTSCAPTVTDCAAHIGKVVTKTIALYTTVCPVTVTPAPKPTEPVRGGDGDVPKDKDQPGPGPEIKTTVYTKTYTISQCPPTVVDCPYGSVITKVVTKTSPPEAHVPEITKPATTDKPTAPVDVTKVVTVTKPAGGKDDDDNKGHDGGKPDHGITVKPPHGTNSTVVAVPTKPSTLTAAKPSGTAPGASAPACSGPGCPITTKPVTVNGAVQKGASFALMALGAVAVFVL